MRDIHWKFATRRAIIRCIASAGAATLAACAGSEPPSVTPALGLRCVDDSAHCITQREKVFDSYMADKSRSWIKQPAAAEAHASGVRLMALSRKRRDLSCDELQHGKREADSAPGALRGPGGKGLTPAQISRGAMLASDVGRELAKEISKRCSRT
ncbi:MAG: hypothetical protein ABL893_07530 [Hyphomicrobium sp.]